MDTGEIQEQLEQAIEQLEEERLRAADLGSALAATEMQVAGLEKRLREANESDELTQLRRELAEQTEAAEGFRVEAADLRSMFDAMQHRIDVLQQKSEQRPEEGRGPADSELESALADARARIAELEASAPADRDLERLEVELSGARGEIDRLTGEVERLMAQVAEEDDELIGTLTREKEDLSAKLDEYVSAASDAIGGPASPEDVRALGPLMHRAAELESRAAEAEGGESELRQALERSESNLAATRKARDQWLERLEESGREKADLQHRLEEMRPLAAKSESLETELADTRNRLEERSGELDSVREELRRSQESLERLEGERTHASEEMREARADADQRLERVQAELDAERVKCSELEELLSAADGELAAAKEEVSARAADADTAQSRVSELETTLRESTAGAEEARGRVGELEGELENLTSRLSSVEGEAGSGAQRIGELEEMLAAAERTAEETRESLAARAQEAEHGGQRIAELETALQESSASGEGARTRIGELERELANAAARLAEVEGDAGAGAQRLSELEELLKEADRELAERSEALASRSTELEAAHGRVGELESSVAEAASRADGDSDRIAALEREVESSQARLAEVEGDAGAGAQRVGELEELLQEADREISESKSQLAARNEELENVQRRIAELDGERQEADARLASQEEQITAMIDRWDLAERQGQSLSASQEEIATSLRELVDEVEATGSIAAELRDGIVQDRKTIDELEARLGADGAAAAELETTRARAEGLEAEVAKLNEALSETSSERSDEAERSRETEEQLREQLADLEAQRSALAEEVENERSQRAVAERLASELRNDLSESGEFDLDGQLRSLQERFDTAVARHAEEVRDLREESALHKDLARQRETEMGKLSEECSILQQSVEDALTELEGVRAERRSLSEELEARPVADAASGANGSVHDLDVDGVPELKLVEDEPSEDTDDVEIGEEDVAAALAEIEGDAGSESLSVSEPDMLVLGVDGDPTFQGAVEEAVGKIGGARFADSVDEETCAGNDVRLVVNLASEQFDLEILAQSDRWGMEESEAIAYCGKDGRGVFFRKVQFFPPPCDLDECSARLLAGADSLQRLLAVGEDVDFMSGLRESLGKVRTSTAIAFDGRQAVDLIPMVKPQMVLVDLNLPRGDGLRVASQIAADPGQRNVKIAMFWSKPVDHQVFRQQAIYAVRDLHLEPEQLTRSLVQALNLEAPARGNAAAFQRQGQGPAASQPGG